MSPVDLDCSWTGDEAVTGRAKQIAGLMKSQIVVGLALYVSQVEPECGWVGAEAVTGRAEQGAGLKKS